MRATRQLLKAKDHIGKGLTGRVQHTGGGTPNESTSGRIHSESFQQASSRVPWVSNPLVDLGFAVLLSSVLLS